MGDVNHVQGIEKGKIDPSGAQGRDPVANGFHEFKYLRWPVPTYVHVKNNFHNENKLAM